MTVKGLLETAVAGLKREYLSPQEQAKITQYILDYSTLAVTTKSIEIESASIVGIGSDTANKPIPDYKFLTFFWSDLDPDVQSVEGLQAREWYLVSHRVLEHMERMLIARAYDDKDNDFLKGEMLVLINGNLQEYKIGSIPLSQDGSLAKEFIEWVGIEPYEIRYTADSEAITETYSSQYQTELRVLQLLRDKAKDIHVMETLSSRELHFTVNRLVYDTRPLAGDTDLHIMWHPWEILDFID